MIRLSCMRPAILEGIHVNIDFWVFFNHYELVRALFQDYFQMFIFTPTRLRYNE